MPDDEQRPWRRCVRVCFNWSLRLILLLVLGVTALLFYLHHVGVPAVIKTRMVNSLRDRGLLLQLGPTRLQGHRLVAESIDLRPIRADVPLQISIGRAILDLDPVALSRARVRLRMLSIERARALWTGPLARSISIDNLEGQLTSRPQDGWNLAAQGTLLGADLRVTGSITNGSALRSWAVARETPGPQSRWPDALHRVADILARVELTSPSLASLDVRGDARDPSALRTEVRVQTPKAVWPGGRSEGTALSASTFRSDAPGSLPEFQFELRSARALFDNADLRGTRLSGRAQLALTNQPLRRVSWDLQIDELSAHSLTGRTLFASGLTLPFSGTTAVFRTQLAVKAAALRTPWGEIGTNQVDADVLHRLTSFRESEVTWRLAAEDLRSRWGDAANFRASGRLLPKPPTDSVATDRSWGYWARLEPYRVECQCEVRGVRSPKLELETASCGVSWRAPHVRIDHLQVALYGGHIQSSGQLDVSTRTIGSKGELCFDVHRVAPLLTKAAQRWLSQFGWHEPPKVLAELRVQLPAWTNAHPRWREEVLPTLELSGELSGCDGTFRGVPVNETSSHFTFTNLVWHLPDLMIRRPDGEALLDYTGHMGTREYQWLVDARMDPRAAKPLFAQEGVKRVLDEFEFTRPPQFKGQVWGRWHHPETLAFVGSLIATNFTFRGERCSQLTTDLQLTNSALTAFNLTAAQGEQEVKLPAGRLDLVEWVIYVTNGVARVDPDLVARLIGPRVRSALRPYHFSEPPSVRVNGRLPTFDIEDADVRFEISGRDFSYWKLRAPTIQGDLDWRAESLQITNVQAGFYGGELNWHGDFDFSGPVGARLAFQGKVRNADLHALVMDLGGRTNRLQGFINGRLNIVAANSDDWRSWQGSGKVQLRDGFLWDIPIFGFFSPVLNTIVPGLGNSRISDGDADFKIDQSEVHTGDLELKSPALRLSYYGSVDLHGKVDARMQAQILRDAWGVGRALSLALWPISKAFEYKVTGTVYHPKTEPVYIPKPFLWPLHPIKTLKRLFTRERLEPGIFAEPEPSDNSEENQP